MQAQLEVVNGQPVLHLEKMVGDYYGGKRAVYDLKLTPEQAKAVNIYMLGDPK